VTYGNIKKLKIGGKAKREAAGHRKFDWGDNLGGWNSAHSNVTWRMCW